MKKVLVGSLVLMSSIYAFDWGQCAKFGTGIDQRDLSKCVDISDDFGYSGNQSSILTKVAGKEFTLHVYRNPTCVVSDLSFELIDEKGNHIADSKSVVGNLVTFKVPNSYKDVRVKISYTKATYKTEPSTCVNSYTGVSYSCPKTVKSTSPVETNSTDNFAIRPDSFGIVLTKNPVKTGTLEITRIKAQEASSEKNVTTNYNNSSLNNDLKITFASNPSKIIKARYSFDIVSGKTNKAQFYFYTEANNTTAKIVDEHYADVDIDDTEGKVEVGMISYNCRYFDGTSNEVNVTPPSGYWAGTGIDKVGSDSCPVKTTVQSKIKQNTIKDSHFQRMGW